LTTRLIGANAVHLPCNNTTSATLDHTVQLDPRRAPAV